MYVPPEIEQRIKLLETEIQQGKKKNDMLAKKSASLRGLSMVLGILFLFALAFIVYVWKEGGAPFHSAVVTEVAPDTVYVHDPAAAPWDSGTYFCVQIGAYKEIDLSLYSEKYAFFRYHLRDGLFKYTLGIFSDYDQAHSFRREIIRLGIKDAFVQAIRDGNPIPIEEALATPQAE